MNYDLIIRNGTLVDGTGAPRRQADLAVKDGRVARIGDLGNDRAERVIDASGQIVAPGVIDVHTHYDASISWDPYATSSCWHGTTSVVTSNCGFGFAPVRPRDRERVMQMMVNTEQIPMESQRASLGWQWETFPEWMEHLRSLPKGVNAAMYLPMNPLLLYVKGESGEEFRYRPTTAVERRRMRELLHEAMDAGACGFSFTLLSKGNNHVDFDGTPVPTDIMEPEDAYNLAWVLREQGQGVIQAMVQHRLDCRQEVTEQLARISGRPVIHNVCGVGGDVPESATEAEREAANKWKETVARCDELRAQGLQVYLQCAPVGHWNEFRIQDFTGFYGSPVLEDFLKADTVEARMAIAADADWRGRARRAFDPRHYIGGGIPNYILLDVHGEPKYAPYQGRKVSEVAELEGKHPLDLFFDVLVATRMQLDFGTGYARRSSGANHAIVLRNPRALVGVSDGGAHTKSFVGGHFSTDFITWLVRDERRLSLEEAHQLLSQRPAEVFGFEGRGVLADGYAADIMIYDFDKLGFDRKYVTVHDMPGGGYRRTLPAHGVSHVLVNGEVIVEAGKTTGAHPGRILGVAQRSEMRVAAE